MAWIYTFGLSDTDYGDGNSTSGWQPQNFAYGGRITFAEAGTIDQLGMYGYVNSGTVAIKIALYDTSGNLIVNSTTTVDQSSNTWYDTATFTATSVSATDYVILYSAASSSPEYAYDSAEDGSFATEGYATFPADPESITLEGDSGLGYAGRANFTASSSDTDLDGTVVSKTITANNATVQADVDINLTGVLDTKTILGQSATIQANIDVDLTGVVDTKTIVANAATVEDSVNTNLTGVVDSLSITVNNASVQIGNDVSISGLADSKTLNTTQLTVSFNVNGVTDSKSLASNNAVVQANVDSNVAGVVDTFTLAANAAVVGSSVDTALSGVVDTKTITANAAAIQADVDVAIGASEDLLSLAAFAASVSIVSGDTDIVAIADSKRIFSHNAIQVPGDILLSQGSGPGFAFGRMGQMGS